jgi:2-polyprenyl-6-methoxyphenol hydroxylase-like FAD-dependent oxidoreductase
MKATKNARKAIIIGGSMGGLLAANMLMRRGWQVDVYERVADELSGRGAGIVTHQELFDALTVAGVTVDDTLGVQVPSRVTFGQDGRIVGEMPYEQILTSWSRLYRGLKDALPDACYHNGRTLARVEQDADCVTAVLADGERVQGDLLIGADGIRSTVRAQLTPESLPEYAGYVGWRGLVEESMLSARTRAALMDRFAFCLPPHEQMLGYPVAGLGNGIEPGQRRYNFVWYRPAGEHTELVRLQTDASGRRHDQGIAPTLIRPEILAEVMQAAQRTLSPEFAEVVGKTDLLFFQPIYDLISTRMVFGRVALLGDAAFVARPHCGMGVTKAAYDAAVLSDALEAAGDDLRKGLADYENERRRFGTSIVTHARHLGAYMQANLNSDLERAMALRYREPEAIMRETAVSLEYLDLP